MSPTVPSLAVLPGEASAQSLRGNPGGASGITTWHRPCLAALRADEHKHDWDPSGHAARHRYSDQGWAHPMTTGWFGTPDPTDPASPPDAASPTSPAGSAAGAGPRDRRRRHAAARRSDGAAGLARGPVDGAPRGLSRALRERRRLLVGVPQDSWRYQWEIADALDDEPLPPAPVQRLARALALGF
jgi:hypothetical protein